MRRGTANVLVTLSAARVQDRFNTLTKRCDVIALQEWPRSRNRMLADRGRLRWHPRPADTPERGAWTFHRTRLGGGPIGVRNALGETVISCRAVLLAAPGFVGRSPGRKSRAVLGPSIATRLKSRRPDGTVVVRYNIHLTAGVQAGEHGYRKDEASARRVARHRAERNELEWNVERDHRRGYEVEVYGDTNFHQMDIPGLVGWWEAEPHHDTFGSRAIDGIWTEKKPDDVDFLRPLVRGEHWHVIASYS